MWSKKICKFLNSRVGGKNIILLVFLLFTVVPLLYATALIILVSKKPSPNKLANTKIIQDYSSINRDVFSDQCRGRILDRNGSILAMNIRSYSFYVRPFYWSNFAVEIAKLRHLFPKKKAFIDSIENKLKSAQSQENTRILIASNLLLSDRQKIVHTGLMGIEFQDSYRRMYPHKNTASHLVGFSNSEGPVMGIERYFDKNLEQGKDVVLSIDINAQFMLRKTIAHEVKKYKANGGFGVIMNVENGEVVAAVSYPDFNPNAYGSYSNASMYNSYAFGVYELGSVFKVFTLALAAKNNMSFTKKYSIEQSIEMGSYTISNFRYSLRRDNLTIPQIMIYSSNIGCVRLIEEIGRNKQIEFYRQLGFDRTLDIEIYEKAKPLWPKQWKAIEMATASYGHGISVSPLHFTAAVAGVVNGGNYIMPTFIKNGNQDDLGKRKGGVSIMTKSSSDQVNKVLSDIVDYGTGKKAKLKDYNIGGKTGTSNKIINGKYDINKVLVSFFAVLPAQNPQYVFYIGIDEPKLDNRRATGGNVVANAIANMVAFTGPMLGITVSKSA